MRGARLPVGAAVAFVFGSSLWGATTFQNLTITGVVLHETLGTPIARATITARRDGVPHSRPVLTDSAGRFEFPELPTGRYDFTVTKPGYVQPPWRPGRPPRIVRLDAGRVAAPIVLTLESGAVIRGTVRTALGRQLPNAMVRALWCDREDVCRPSQGEGARAITDDQGDFRLFGLEPGDYVVTADARLDSDTQDIVRLPDSILRAAEREAERGTLDGLLALADSLHSQRGIAYLTTFAPNVTNIEGADRIHLEYGSQDSDRSVTLQVGTTASISGQLSALPPGLPALRRLFLFPDQPTMGLPPPTALVVDAGGRFVRSGLRPGAYRIAARLTASDRSAWIERRFVLDASDLDLGVLNFEEGHRVSGRIVLENSDGSTVPVGGSVQARRTDVRVSVSTLDRIEGRANGDGAFQLLGMMPGRYSLTATLPKQPGEGLWVKSVLDGAGQDFLDRPFIVQNGGPTPPALTIVVGRSPSIVRGSVRDEEGNAAADFSVVLFPQEASWRSISSRVARAEVADDGTFEVRGLPDGDYYVAAVGMPASESITLDLLDVLSPVSQSASVRWATTTTVSVVLQRPGRRSTTR